MNMFEMQRWADWSLIIIIFEKKLHRLLFAAFLPTANIPPSYQLNASDSLLYYIVKIFVSFLFFILILTFDF
jgi:hypothetical protein